MFEALLEAAIVAHALRVRWHPLRELRDEALNEADGGQRLLELGVAHVVARSFVLPGGTRRLLQTESLVPFFVAQRALR